MIKKIFFQKLINRPEFEMVMSKNEKTLFKNTIKNSKYYLEFGSGGSTFYVLKRSNAQIVSVESDRNWIEILRRSSFIVKQIKNKRITFLYVNIGPTRKWGFPKGNAHRLLFPAYSSEAFKTIPSESIDTVFVDGRFRVACVLNTIIHYINKKDVNILIHDFNNRSHYHILLNYLTVIKSIDTMILAIIKEKIDIEQLQKDYHLYKYIPK